MQGTIAMLMALSGLGCHHKSCGPAVVESCYSGCYSSCYASAPIAEVVVPSCYASSCYASSCYASSCYANSCYASSCYSSCYSGGHRKHGLGGLFHHKRRAVVAECCNLGV